MFRRKEARRAFGQALREGKGKTHHSPHLRFKAKPTKESQILEVNADILKFLPDVWADLQAGHDHKAESQGVGRRQSQETEAQACRELRIYRKCSRNCKPREFGGCKGWKIYSSCPKPEAQENKPQNDKPQGRKDTESRMDFLKRMIESL